MRNKGLLFVLGLFGLLSCCHAGVTVDFTLLMSGTCTDTNSSDFGTFCTAKGNSQAITSTISDDNGVEEAVANKIGSYAILNANLTSLDQNTFIGEGNMTFGTHLSRQHTLIFESLGVGFSLPTNETFVFSFGSTFTAFGSAGVFQDSHGAITVNGYLNVYTTQLSIFVNGIIYDVYG